MNGWSQELQWMMVVLWFLVIRVMKGNKKCLRRVKSLHSQSYHSELFLGSGKPHHSSLNS